MLCSMVMLGSNAVYILIVLVTLSSKRVHLGLYRIYHCVEANFLQNIAVKP